MRRRLALLAASLLTGVVLASPGPAAAAPQPDCFEIDFAQACFSAFHDVFVDDVLCDFPVDVDVVGSIRYRPHFAHGQSGDLASEASHTVFNATIVNPATGRSFVDGSNFNERATFLADGSVEVRRTGVFHNVRVDDGQRLFHQSGQDSVLIDPGDQVVEEIFHGRWDSEPAFPGKVCPILAVPRG
jgi:hypothetical protein